MRDNDWRLRLRQLRDKPADAEFPLRVFKFGLPSSTPWPPALPASALIKEFYTVIDGGWFGVDCDWYSLAELERKNAKYHKLLENWNIDNTTPFQLERHLVFGHDAGGTPYIWNAADDSVSIFGIEGGGWCKLAPTFEQFLSNLLFPLRPASEHDLWYDALAQLDSQNTSQ